MSDFVKITIEAAGAAWVSADRALDRTVQKIQNINAKIAAVQAEIDNGQPRPVNHLHKLARLTAQKLKATESMLAHHEVAKFANDMLTVAREREKKNG